MLVRPSMFLTAVIVARAAAAADDALSAALGAAREAIERNQQMKSVCQKSLGAKLNALEDSLEDLQGRPTAPGVAHALDRIAAATALLEDKCPSMVVQVVGRSLDEIAAHLRVALRGGASRG